MSTMFNLCGKSFNVDDIKDFYVLNKDYIYRPKYLCDKTLRKRLSHNVYSFVCMEPYLALTEGVVLEDIKYLVKNSNGSIDEEKRTTIKSSTKDYRVPEVRSIQCLIIVADQEYCFYGAGIDLQNIKREYNRLKFIKNGEKTDSKVIKSVTTLLNITEYCKRKVKLAYKWFKGLNGDKKVLISLVGVFLLCTVVILVGVSLEIGNETNDVSEGFQESATYATDVSEILQSDETTYVAVAETASEKNEEITKEIIDEKLNETTNGARTDAAAENANKAATEKNDTEETKSGITVYITPYGEKYHYSSNCAGKNAMERDLSDVEGIYDPCKKCAQ